MLDYLRRLIPATSRERIYTYTVAIVMMLVGLGYLSNTLAALWIAVLGASVTLIFALLHSLSPWRTALYGLLAAAAPLLLWYSIGTEQGWAAVLGFAGVLFGITTAATNTRVLGLVVDGSAVSHHLQDVDEALNAVDGSSSRGRHARNEE
ncbi:hypothetical protein GS504_24475 [Rhodococcus hoagii]|uniref:phage holin n=1 Tax=Rhodococcus hoagii TaxID=43767 RepID=UPI001980601C|nr:hypothetical protein [Prescottella equi]MBM4708712.1 hypothetical protein [Prescottella equi]MBM4711101.1 hypothetical protein [Prescottella equi]NKR28923.1 hypothetical protein [Prescottella equi]NKR30643.1 hypothetical protein [Prescottella equi]NKS02629.1 hypothetical protein [Prescottella equi]